ncbi:Calcineurin-like phosphoesterase domain, apaH type [Trema orientale]|uniref:acid phosphatase n=1 Tax=Trema orientale TaxID=63057 RepID=A0A2P5FG75_TREOI|nr:Calcineurin-like phosphoesterase domain, apaH type [Trema orientale]
MQLYYDHIGKRLYWEKPNQLALASPCVTAVTKFAQGRTSYQLEVARKPPRQRTLEPNGNHSLRHASNNHLISYVTQCPLGGPNSISETYRNSLMIMASRLIRSLLISFIVTPAFLFILCLHSVSAELPRLEHPTKADGSLSLLVVGDWGRKGAYNQSQVALQMGRIGEKLSINFVISTGDNFYDDGLRSINDPAFENSFTKVYTAKSLQKPWYNVLGNHDYRGNVMAQLNPVFRNIDSRWLCMRSFVVNSEIAEFFFVDTTPFVDKYFLRPKHHRYDWRGVLPRKGYLSNLLKDLDLALINSAANWKFVVGHHGIRSAGHHGDTKELVKQLLPVLEANEVDLYINGHDHCLQHISSTTSPIQFLTSGGGSKAWKGEFNTSNRDGLRFYYDGQGFMSVQLTPTDASVYFYNIYGRVMHSLNLSKGLHSAA